VQQQNSEAGLTDAQAAHLLARDGFNELPSAKPRNLFLIALDVVREPMFLLLIACGTIYLLLGDTRDALMLIGFVVIIMAISLIQQHKTERSLDALKNLSSPRALVIRNGKQLRVPGREVVVDDLVVLNEGDRVPADGILLSCLNLRADESLLTGESAPVDKIATTVLPSAMPAPGIDTACVYAGSLIVGGKGIARMLATGRHSAIGKIAHSLAAMEQQPTRLQLEIQRVVVRVAWGGILLSAFIAVIYGALHAQWLDGLLVGITVAMAILPEELPVVLTLFLGLGAWRIAQRRVLTRHISSLETLGATTVLCVDKTGTLTENRMEVEQLVTATQHVELGKIKKKLPEEFHALLEFGVLASHRDPFDPMERAIHDALQQTLANTEHVHDDWQLVEEYPLSRELLAMSRAWRSPRRDYFVVATKGAPEAIADLCHLDAVATANLLQQATMMAEQGLRVLGVASARFQQPPLPDIQHEFVFELLGLIGLADPVRAAVPNAVHECREAGVRVVMMTGDHPATALSIARQIGFDVAAGYLTGPSLDALDDAALQAQLKTINVFCRMTPDQKLRLVHGLKKNGEIVAMTGDGVNDAPALKAAHIGIAMGQRGTDVAREAADLVLMDDDFASIVAAIRAGRRIFDNLGKAMAFIIAVHLPIIGLSLLPVLFNWPLMLMPVHVLFLQLIIDPACSVVFEVEPGERDLMRRPPRAPNRSLISRALLGISVLEGSILLAIVLSLFFVSQHWHMNSNAARAFMFVALIIANLGLIIVNRTRQHGILNAIKTPNVALWWVCGAALAMLTAVLTSPWLRQLFHFDALGIHEWLTALGAGLLSVVVFDALKYWSRQLRNRSVNQPEHTGGP